MTDEGDMRELIGRVLATQEAHGREICLMRKDLKDLSVQVTEHRVGWKVNIWIGSACLVIGAALIGYWKA